MPHTTALTRLKTASLNCRRAMDRAMLAVCEPTLYRPYHARLSRSIDGRSPRALPLIGARGHLAMPGSMPKV
jgi:hypothetical protein